MTVINVKDLNFEMKTEQPHWITLIKPMYYGLVVVYYLEIILSFRFHADFQAHCQ